MEHLQTSDMYGEYLPHLNVNLNTSSFPASPVSAEKSAKALGLPYNMTLLRDQAPFGGKRSMPQQQQGKDGMFDNMMSPPITPGDNMHNYSSAGSSQLSSPMPTFSNDLQGRSVNLQFNLSPPLTLSGSPDLQYGDLYQTQEFDNYSEQQPIYNFMGIDPNMQEAYEDVNYDAPLSADAYAYNNNNAFNRKVMKEATSEGSLASWHPVVQGDNAYSTSLIQNDWQNNDLVHQAGDKTSQGGHFECDFPGCGKTFTKHTNLKSHSRIHHSERNYNCQECHATFRRSHDLKRHQRSLHSEVKPYACGRCSKRFSRMDALKRHTSRTTSACYNQSFP